MNFLKKIGCAAAIAFAAGSAQAEAIMNNWTFDADGAGSIAGRVINEYLDVNGNAFIRITPTGGTSFSFTEYGAFNLSQSDSLGQSFGTTITATLEAYGTGNFNGQFAFVGGVIRMYQNPVAGQYGTAAGYYGADRGNLIGTFNVMAGGGGRVDASGDPTGNGQVSIRAQSVPGQLAAGYFFADNGVDMSTIKSTSFAFTNANTIGSPTAISVSEIACQFGGFAGPGCVPGTSYSNVPGSYFMVSNNGQFKFADIPEPGSVALFGIALFGIGALRRRVK